MNKSSVLSKAGHESLSNQIINPVLMQKPSEKPQNSLNYLKSSLADNLLQQMDDEYPEIQYETQYLNESGQYLDESGKQVPESNPHMIESRNFGSEADSLSPSRASSNNEFLPQKSKLTKNRFSQQPIVEESHQAEEQQTDSPIKGLNTHFSKPSSKQSNSGNIFSLQQSPQRPGTLLKSYKASNKYDYELEMVSEQKRNMRSKLAQKGSYLTNSRGLREDDFYRVDYSNSGQYKPNASVINSSVETSPAFFNTRHNDLESIEDILSDIASLNESSSKAKYGSGKVFAKGSIDSLGMGKYKGNKNFASFGSSRKFNSSLRENGGSTTSKLDDLVTSYKFGEGMMGLSGLGSSLIKGEMGSQGSAERSVGNESGMSFGQNMKEKSGRGLRRIQREENRRSSKQYEEVRNEIKYGIDGGDQNEREQAKENGSGLDRREREQGQIEVELNGQKNKNNNLGQVEGPGRQAIQLLKKLRLYQIDWRQIALIPVECESCLHEFKSYPNFSEDQTELLVSVFGKLHTSKLHTYSIFASPRQSGPLVGVRELVAKPGAKASVKGYKLLGKKEFIQTWNSVYEESLKSVDAQSHALSQEQIEILIEFDLKWYTALAKFVYHKDLSTLTDSYKNIPEHQYQSAVDSSQYIQTLARIQNYVPSQHLSLRQAIAFNKLSILKSIFSTLNASLSEEHSFGIVPSLISADRTQKEELLIKNFLKHNFRGAIYFTDTENFKNICILQLNPNPSLQIQQISTQLLKQVSINQKVLLNILSSNPPIPQPPQKQLFQIDIMLAENPDQDEYEETQNLKLHCRFNQIQYEIDQETIPHQLLHFCKKYQVQINP